MITVHLIGNAHLDPVWLWRWPAGVGEAIATCRSAVERLDEYPEFVFTRSDMWVHEQIEKLDPGLFARVREYVKSGRWQIVGGWYIQPDCNLPTVDSFNKHISMGKAYFKEKFHIDITVGYNVDSFGHNAMIPSLLKKSGYDSYVMMRPMAHEKKLPASLFRWRSPDNEEIMVWRIPRAYTAWQEDLTDHIKASLEAASPGIDHVMCFYGVGDHGGGPTKSQIEWLTKYKGDFPNAKLEFSHPRRFFDAVKPFINYMPIVEDELQYHSIGCYSVVHELKRNMRRAEHGLVSAENVIHTYSEEAPDNASKNIDEAWKKTLFNQFHDIYAGTSLGSAYEDSRDQLGSARDTGDSIIYSTLFRKMRHLPKDPFQRIVAFNISGQRFSGYLQHEPWILWRSFDGWLADENGQRVPYQRVQQETVSKDRRCLIWPAEIPPNDYRVFQLRTDPAPSLPESHLKVEGNIISNKFYAIEPGKGANLISIRRIRDKSNLFDDLHLMVRHDQSDTWSHGIDRFKEPVIGDFQVKKVYVEESGPVRATIRVEASFSESRLVLWARLYDNCPILEISLCLDWRQKLQISKLIMPIKAAIKDRLDGIPGGYISRQQNGQEFPIVDWTMVRHANGNNIGIVCPDCSALDGEENQLRFTLLRSPVYAWHDPAKLEDKTFYRWTDQGEHAFRFFIWEDTTPYKLENLAISEHRQPICLDWTDGQKS